MNPRLPVPVRRIWRLFEARRALLWGAPERALALLRDPSVTLSWRADELRARALAALYRAAAERCAAGHDASLARILSLVAVEDPARAHAWHQELVPGPAAEPPGRLRELLARMRASSGSRATPPGRSERVKASAPSFPAFTRAGSRAFHLAVDDGGEYLVVAGESLVVGHARAGRADIPFLADLESEHARLSWSESFHGGAHWRVEPTASGAAWLNGRRVGSATMLSDGDEVRLSTNVAFVFRLPESASGSALLELVGGAEAEGTVHVLLMVPGTSGRIRIGSQARRHIPVAGLEHEVSLVLEPEHLKISCAGGVRRSDGGAHSAKVEEALPCPPAARVDLRVNARPSQRLPFTLSLRPLEGARRAPEGGACPPGGGA